MSDKKDISNSNTSKDTLKKSVTSRPRVDGLYKKKKVISTVEDVFVQNTEILTQQTQENTGRSVDDERRLFLKVAGVAGLGLAAGALFPKSAEAYVAGSTPTSNVVGLKDSANARIDPAKEGGNLASIKTNTDPLVASGAGGYIRQDSTATIAKETGGNLAGIKTNTDKFNFDISGNLLTAGGAAASEVGITDKDDNRITPVQDDSVILLRRIVKLMESQAVVDSGNRQRITLDSLGTGTAVTTTVPVSGTVTATVAAATVTTVSTVSAITTFLGQNQQAFQDVAKTAYNTGIRQNLSFT